MQKTRPPICLAAEHLHGRVLAFFRPCCGNRSSAIFATWPRKVAKVRPASIFLPAQHLDGRILRFLGHAATRPRIFFSVAEKRHYMRSYAAKEISTAWPRKPKPRSPTYFLAENAQHGRENGKFGHQLFFHGRDFFFEFSESNS